MFELADNVAALAFAASILLNSRNPFPYRSMALEIRVAAWLSPSARMIAASFSCSAYKPEMLKLLLEGK